MNQSEHKDKLGFGKPVVSEEQSAIANAYWRAHMISNGQDPDRCGIYSNTEHGKRCKMGYHHSGECEFEK